MSDVSLLEVDYVETHEGGGDVPVLFFDYVETFVEAPSGGTGAKNPFFPRSPLVGAIG